MYHVQEDVRMAVRGGELAFVRTYNSQSTVSGPMGYGWSHTYDISLNTSNPFVAKIREGDGRGAYFIKMPDGTYSGLYGERSTLVANGDGSYTQTLRDGMKYRFSVTSQLTRIEDPNGNATVLLI
jgi:hypothetical protein